MKPNFDILPSPTTQKIDISVAGRNLKDIEYFSKIDPKVQMFTKDPQGKWVFYDETETIKNNLDPDFTKSFTFMYNFEKKQPIKFHVVDVDPGKKADIIGDVETTVGQIMGAKCQTMIFDVKLNNVGASRGKLIIRCEAINNCNEWLYMEFKGRNISSGALCCGTVNPKLSLYQAERDGTWDKVHETEVIPGNSNPIWKGMEISVSLLTNGDHERQVKMTLYNQEGDEARLLGETKWTINDLIQREIKEFRMMNPVGGAQKGTVLLSKINITMRPSFIDYLRGGLRLNTVLCVDYTGSNGDTRDQASLHSIFPGTLNQYQAAIDGVMAILIHYDSDQQIGMYGFGAIPKYPNLRTNEVLHCFPITGDPANPYAIGLQQVDAIYKNSLKYLVFSGPTYFAPLLKESIKIVQEKKDAGSAEYTIMVIMTDGQINDIDETIDCIVECSYLPISIIIVGIGNADFSSMEILDADRGPLQGRNCKLTVRDCVQFVPFSRYKGNQEALAEKVLEEVPNQVVNYYRAMNISPKPPIQMNLNEIDINYANLQPGVPFMQQQLPSGNPLQQMNQGIGYMPPGGLMQAQPNAGFNQNIMIPSQRI